MSAETRDEAELWMMSQELADRCAKAVAQSQIQRGKSRAFGHTVSIKQSNYQDGMAVIQAINKYMTELEDKKDLTGDELLKVLADVMEPEFMNYRPDRP